MNLSLELFRTGSDWKALCSGYVLEHESHFWQLMEVFLHCPPENYRLSQRSSALILEVIKVYPQWLNPWALPMSKALFLEQSTSMKRNFIANIAILGPSGVCLGETGKPLLSLPAIRRACSRKSFCYDRPS